MILTICMGKNQDAQTDSFFPMDYAEKRCKYYSPLQFATTLASTKKALSVFNINCQSINAHWDDLQNLFYDLSTPHFSFDIISLTEVFRNHEFANHTLNGYHPLIVKSRPDNDDGRGGVGIYIKDTLDFNVREDLSVFVPHVYESIFVEVKINKKESVIIGVIYRPNTPPKADLDHFEQIILETIGKINAENKKTCSIGGLQHKPNQLQLTQEN